VLQQFGPVYGIIAHSIGAACTIYALTTHQSSELERLVLISSPCELKNLMAHFAAILQLPDSVSSQMYKSAKKRLGRPVEFFSVQSLAQLVKIPSLCIHDRSDQRVPFSDAEKIVSKWDDATLIATDHLDHRGILRNSDVIKRVVNFMSNSKSDGDRQQSIEQ